MEHQGAEKLGGGRKRPKLQAAIDNTEERVGMGQGVEPSGGVTTKRSKIRQEGPEELAGTARGERGKVRRVVGVGCRVRRALGRGLRLRRAATPVAPRLQEAVQRSA